MIEIIEGLPSNVLGIVVKGRVQHYDCHAVLLPALQRACEWHHRLRLYYEIRSRCPGALWDEMAPSLMHGVVWDRVAIVADVASLRYSVQALRLLLPGDIRVFATVQTPDALAWVVDQPGRQRRQRAPVVIDFRASQTRGVVPAQQFLDQHAQR
jgi:hypothetical protein